MSLLSMKQKEESSFMDIFLEVLNTLPQKERIVMQKRLGIGGEKETLQHIGESFTPSISRERVRQIENIGIKKIGRIIKATKLVSLQKMARDMILQRGGGVLIEEKLINYMIQSLQGNIVSGSVLNVILQTDSELIRVKGKQGIRTYFYLPFLNPQLFEKIHDDVVSFLKKRKDVIERNVLYKIIEDKHEQLRGNTLLIDSVIDIYEDVIKGEDNLIALTSWKILNPQTLKEKAIYVLKKEKIPMHFVSIANRITELLKEPVRVNTVHNELIRNPEFVLVGRGIYGLREWGIYKPGTVFDVIIEVLKKHGRPMKVEEIIAEVLHYKKVKPATVYMNLQKKSIIERVGRSYYQLKQD